MKKVLLVDDDRTHLRLLSKRLENEGYDVYLAEDGAAGFEMAQAIRPDVLVLDIMMPGINGYTVCGLLKSNRDYRSIPIIILTSRNRDEDKIFDDTVAPEAYMTKPFVMEEVVGKIAELIS